MSEYWGAPDHLRCAPNFSLGGQARVDAVQNQFRAERRSIRRDPATIAPQPPAPPVIPPTQDPLFLKLAEELEYSRRRLDVLGDNLSADTLVTMRHGISLQALDIVGQVLGHLADIVRSSDPSVVVDRIGMTELKGRLKPTRL